MKPIILPVFLLFFFHSTLSAQLSSDQINTFLEDKKTELGLSKADISDWVISDQHTSRQSGVTHVYLRQKLNGLEIEGADLGIHRLPNGEIWNSASRFISNAHKLAGTKAPRLSAAEAITAAAHEMGYSPAKTPQQLELSRTNEAATLYQLNAFSKTSIPAQLVYQLTKDKKLQLAWKLAVNETKNGHWWGITVDAQEGKILAQNSWTQTCHWGHDHTHQHQGQETDSYQEAIPLAPLALVADASYHVFPAPVESPIHGSRSIVVDPADPDASPFGWHDTDGVAGAEDTRAKGNNVQAHLDDNDSDNQTGFSPDGGADLDFDFPFNSSSAPTSYQPAAITNLFYWNNILHDVLYHYGFDEAAGNFQENNYGNDGNDGDSVNADAQDGSGTNNANFGTPPDGSNPRMQMYIWTAANPDRDSDFDNGVIAHEYGHGVSNRLTGGGKNVSCLSNVEQMGEGWSDFLGLIFTIEPADDGTDSRGIGNYVKNFAPDGDGIRTHPYSTNLGVNPHTYDDIRTESRPHGIGSVWCAMLWEMTWALIDDYGFDEDLYHGTGGNNMALQLVMEGMKLQPCSPGFVDGRNAILKADKVLFGGANQCLIWKAFAKRGLGYSASQGDSDLRADGTEAFDLPPDCHLQIKLTGTPSTLAGGNIDYEIEVENVSDAVLTDIAVSNVIPDSTTLLANSISDGGSENNGVIEWPLLDLQEGSKATRTFSVVVSPTIPFEATFSDDMEGTTEHWKTFANNPSRSEWQIVDMGDNGNVDNEWFAAEPDNHNDQYLTLNPTFKIGLNSELSFNHSFDTEDTWDGGQVHVSTDGGRRWIDLGTRMTQFPYNSTINDNSQAPAFAGNSNGYQTTIVDLADFVGELVKIRFWFHADAAVGGDGWWVDDIALSQVDFTIDNCATATQNGQTIKASMAVPTIIESGALPVELGGFKARAVGTYNQLDWHTLSEASVESFKIFRSPDGITAWTSIGEVAAVGNSFSQQEYTLEDKKPWAETFYRLETHDFDGSISKSAVVRVFREALSLSLVDIYPNPFSEEVQVSFNLRKSGPVMVSLQSLYGSQIKNWEWDGELGNNQLPLALESFPQGVYLLQIQADGQQQTRRLLKQ